MIQYVCDEILKIILFKNDLLNALLYALMRLEKAEKKCQLNFYIRMYVAFSCLLN